MRRREFIASLGGVAAARALPLQAQQVRKLPTIGILGAGTPASHGPWFAALVHRLRELGWIDGRNVSIEYGWPEGHADSTLEIIARFIRLNVDIIVTSTTPNVVAAKRATSVIPIVFAAAGDPVGTGLVASLARPGGNVTGFSLEAADLAGKRLGLLREAMPRLRQLAMLSNAGNPNSKLEISEVQATARALGVEVVVPEITRIDDIAPAIEALKGRVDAIYIQTDALMNANQVRINKLALEARLPTISGAREYVEAGSLMSYGPSFPDLFRRAGDYVDAILRGAKPADLPVQLPTKFDLVVSLVAARDLGLTIPPSLLASADEVIE
jgi:putative ABC transport system substrate-binding protein